MQDRQSIDLGYGITCLDADYMRDGLACLYLMQQGDELAVIETGTSHSVPHLLHLLERRGLDPAQVRYVIPTHVHLDHAGGAGAMMQCFANATLLAHPRGARHLVDPEKLIAGSKAVYGEEVFEALYGNVEGIAAGRVEEVADGARYQLADRTLLFRHTPGHADHHFCIWDEQSRGWFTGDVMGISYPELRFAQTDFVLPTTTPVQFRPQQLLASIELLAASEPQCFYLTHFSRLDNQPAVTERLTRQIQRYCEIALQASAAENRIARITEGLWQYTRDELAAADAPDNIDYEKLLQFDLQLNAQGLDVWLNREAASAQ